MVRNWANKNFKGFAYIEYKDPNSLKKAIKKYHNQLYEGRRLICDASVNNIKKVYKKRTP
jgi:RNA recognition motif-containing protein